MLAGGKASKDS
jgi:hypothetical protein